MVWTDRVDQVSRVNFSVDFGRILNGAVQVGRSSRQAWWRAGSERLSAEHGMVGGQVVEATLPLVRSVRVDVFQIWSGDGGGAWLFEISYQAAGSVVLSVHFILELLDGQSSLGHHINQLVHVIGSNGFIKNRAGICLICDNVEWRHGLVNGSAEVGERSLTGSRQQWNVRSNHAV